MNLPYILIDFENVQPKVLERLRPGQARVKVFLGQHQNKLMLELVQALQPFGGDVEYIQIHGSGPNAVDFHIAFYLGQLAATEPKASFTIVSKDRGYDPLLRHLDQRRISCKRLSELPALPEPSPVLPTKKAAVTTPPKPAPAKPAAAAKAGTKAPAKKVVPATPPATATTARARAKAVVEHLKKSSKPAKLATLRSTIKALLKPAPDDKVIDAIIQSLKDSKKISVVGEKVAYALS